MPRPMVPAPATAATRSLRETSSMGGKAVILAVGGVAIIVIQEEVHGLNREARGRGGAACRRAPCCRARIPLQADHPDLPLAPGRHPPAPPSQICPARPETPRPAG